MGLKDLKSAILKAEKISCDANCFIYYFEAHKKFGPLAKEIFEALKKEKIKIFCSTILLTELLVSPFRDKDKNLISLYLSLKEREGFTFVAPSVDIAIQAAKLRAKYNVKAPDAIHLATAIDSEVGFFITNDEKLKKVEEIETLVLKDFTP